MPSRCHLFENCGMCDRVAPVKVPWPTRPLILPYSAPEFVPGPVPDGGVSDDALGEFGLLPVGVRGGRGRSVRPPGHEPPRAVPETVAGTERPCGVPLSLTRPCAGPPPNRVAPAAAPCTSHAYATARWTHQDAPEGGRLPTRPCAGPPPNRVTPADDPEVRPGARRPVRSPSAAPAHPASAPAAPAAP